jgi:hypothetical protein
MSEPKELPPYVTEKNLERRKVRLLELVAENELAEQAVARTWAKLDAVLEAYQAVRIEQKKAVKCQSLAFRKMTNVNRCIVAFKHSKVSLTKQAT